MVVLYFLWLVSLGFSTLLLWDAVRLNRYKIMYHFFCFYFDVLREIDEILYPPHRPPLKAWQHFSPHPRNPKLCLCGRGINHRPLNDAQSAVKLEKKLKRMTSKEVEENFNRGIVPR